jgi:hypothetical protein
MRFRVLRLRGQHLEQPEAYKGMPKAERRSAVVVRVLCAQAVFPCHVALVKLTGSPYPVVLSGEKLTD